MIEEVLHRHPRLVIALARLIRRLDGSFEQIKAEAGTGVANQRMSK